MTVTEIARLAGVSIGTVDRVLHDRGRVSAETREKIRRIIETEGFQPNPLARHLKRNRGYLIGVLMPSLESESGYWNLMYEAIGRAAAEYAVFSLEVRHFPFERTDRRSLDRAWKAMLDSSCDGLVIAPVMQEETLLLLAAEPPAVPYCLIDSPLPGSAPVSTVAQDPFQGGFLAGRMMSLLCPGAGPFAAVRPYTEAFNLNERARGFRAWFEAAGGGEVVDVLCPDSPAERRDAVLDGILDSRPDIRGFFAVSSIGHAVAERLKLRGLKGSRKVIGYDLVAENRECLRSGLIDCLISQRPEEQGRIAVSQLYRSMVLEEESEGEIAMPLDIYFKENLV